MFFFILIKNIFFLAKNSDIKLFIMPKSTITISQYLLILIDV